MLLFKGSAKSKGVKKQYSNIYRQDQHLAHPLDNVFIELYNSTGLVKNGRLFILGRNRRNSKNLHQNEYKELRILTYKNGISGFEK